MHGEGKKVQRNKTTLPFLPYLEHSSKMKCQHEYLVLYLFWLSMDNLFPVLSACAEFSWVVLSKYPDTEWHTKKTKHNTETCISTKFSSFFVSLFCSFFDTRVALDDYDFACPINRKKDQKNLWIFFVSFKHFKSASIDAFFNEQNPGVLISSRGLELQWKLVSLLCLLRVLTS